MRKQFHGKPELTKIIGLLPENKLNNFQIVYEVKFLTRKQPGAAWLKSQNPGGKNSLS